MTTYTATFSDGTTISRNSKRLYAAAWRATWTEKNGTFVSFEGFSISAEKVNAYKPSVRCTGRGFSAKQNAAAKRLNQEHVSSVGYRVEIVPALAS